MALMPVWLSNLLERIGQIGQIGSGIAFIWYVGSAIYVAVVGGVMYLLAQASDVPGWAIYLLVVAVLTLGVWLAIGIRWWLDRRQWPATPEGISESDLNDVYKTIAASIDALSNRVDAQFGTVDAQINSLAHEIQNIRATLSRGGLGGLLDPASRLSKIESVLAEISSKQNDQDTRLQALASAYYSFKDDLVARLQAKQALDRTERLHQRLDNVAVSLASAGQNPSEVDWEEWGQVWGRWRGELGLFSELVQPYVEANYREVLFNAPPDMYKSSNWDDFDESAFPTSDNLLDYKTFRILWQNYQSAGAAAKRRLKIAATV